KIYFNNMPDILNIKKYNFFLEYEIGYKYFNSFIKSFTDNYIWLFFFIAIITLTILLYYNYKYCTYPFFTLTFYMYKTFFYTNFVAMRQSIAIAIFIFSIKYIINGSFKKYFILVLLATLFHSSAIVLVFLYFLRYVNLRKMKFINIILIGIFIMIFSMPIIKLIGLIIGLIGGTETVLNKINSIHGSLGINLHVIEMIVLYIVFAKNYKITNEKEKIWFNLFVTYCILIISFSSQVIFIRIAMYFYFPIMIFISSSLEKIKNSKYKILLVYIFTIIFFIGYVKYLKQFDSGGLIPYKSILIK
ncbi:EpsG family protein, partial [Clostridium perfringens]